MPRILRSTKARADMLAIWLYIALQDTTAADRILDEIESSLQMLARYPDVGHRRSESVPVLRRFPVGQYIVFYESIGDGVQIVRVLHGARFHDILL